SVESSAQREIKIRAYIAEAAIDETADQEPVAEYIVVARGDLAKDPFAADAVERRTGQEYWRTDFVHHRAEAAADAKIKSAPVEPLRSRLVWNNRVSGASACRDRHDRHRSNQ